MAYYYVRGSGDKIRLTDKNFIARGGEKSVYAVGGTAYCVYHDPANAIPTGKIQELAVLDRPEIVRPLAELLDDKQRHVGETMPFVQDSWAPHDHAIRPLVLCQLFTNAFRRKHGITTDHVVKITDSMLDVLRYCHAHRVLLVDPNETNWLVHHSLSSTFLIDTSCCQTEHYPGTAIKPAIRDWERHGFSVESDRFSLAVVLAWLWVGIHPYVAYHPDWNQGDAADCLEPRMRKHASFFDPQTQFNRACRALSDIPGSLFSWLRAVLHEGKRDAPPASCTAPIQVQPAPMQRFKADLSPELTLTQIEVHERDILAVFRDVVVSSPGVVFGFTPRKNIPVRATVENGMVELSTNKLFSCYAQQVIESEGRIYAVGRHYISEIVFNENVSPMSATAKVVATLADLPTTKAWPGCVMQNLLGRYILATFPDPGRCQQHFLPELDGWQILDCRFIRGVFIAMTEQSGRYRMVRYRFWGKQDFTELSQEIGDVNFAVNDRGICLAMLPNGELLSFHSAGGTISERRFRPLTIEVLLFSRGAKMLGAHGKTLYELTALKQEVSQ